MNQLIINGTVQSLSCHSEQLLAFNFDIQNNKKKSCYIIFRTDNEERKEKLKELLTEGTPLLLKGRLETYPELPPKAHVRVIRFYFLESLHEKLTKTFMTLDEINAFLDKELNDFNIYGEETDYE